MKQGRIPKLQVSVVKTKGSFNSTNALIHPIIYMYQILSMAAHTVHVTILKDKHIARNPKRTRTHHKSFVPSTIYKEDKLPPSQQNKLIVTILSNVSHI